MFGLAIHFLIFKPLRDAPILAKVVSSVGLFLLLQAIVVRRFATNPQTLKPLPFVDKTQVDLGILTITQEGLFVTILVIVFAFVLWLLFQRTRFGLATRAAAENERGAVVLGFNPDVLAAVNWVLAVTITGLLGIFVASIQSSVDPLSLPALIVPALSAALVGGFTLVCLDDRCCVPARHAEAADRLPQREPRVVSQDRGRSTVPWRRNPDPAAGDRGHAVPAGQRRYPNGAPRRSAGCRTRRRRRSGRCTSPDRRSPSLTRSPRLFWLTPGVPWCAGQLVDRDHHLPVARRADRIRRADLARPDGVRRVRGLRRVEALQRARLAVPDPDLRRRGRRRRRRHVRRTPRAPGTRRRTSRS